MTSIAGRAALVAGAKHAARSVWAARLGRLALGARGVLYVLLAYLTVEVAFGAPNSGADRQAPYTPSPASRPGISCSRC